MAVSPSIPPLETQALHSAPSTYDEIGFIYDLLHDEEGMTLSEAMGQAADMLNMLDAYAAAWDSLAFMAGNDAAMPF